MAKQNKLTQRRINLIRYFLVIKGKSEIIALHEGGNNIPNEKIRITLKGITRWYGSRLEDREWTWDECDNYDIQCAFSALDLKIKKFFGIENCQYVDYTYDWKKIKSVPLLPRK